MQAHIALNDIDAAVESFKHALELEPNDGMFSLLITMKTLVSCSCEPNRLVYFSTIRWNQKRASCSKEEGCYDNSYEIGIR
jgi:hypothetical protein